MLAIITNEASGKWVVNVTDETFDYGFFRENYGRFERDAEGVLRNTGYVYLIKSQKKRVIFKTRKAARAYCDANGIPWD